MVRVVRSSKIMQRFIQALSVASLIGLLSCSQLITPATQVKNGNSSAIGGFTWRNVNLQGMGYVTGMVISPNPPYDVYIRTDVGGSYRFDRSNNRWVPLMDSFASKSGIGVESIAIAPQQPEQVYAVIEWPNGIEKKDQKATYTLSAEVFHSTDRGATWKPMGLGAKNVFTGPNSDYRMLTGERLVVDPNQAKRLFFASRRDGLWRYEGSWQRVQGGLPEPDRLPNFLDKEGKPNGNLPGFTFIAFDTRSGKAGSPTPTLYMGVHGLGSAAGGVWQSKDGGNSWKPIGGANNPLRGVVAADGTLYVVFGAEGDQAKTGSIRKFKNGQWSDISPEKERTYSGISVQVDRPDRILAVSDDRVYRSTNGGTSWAQQTMTMNGTAPADNPQEPLNPTAPGYYTFASGGASTVVIDPANPRHAWWMNGWGVARTEDATVEQPTWVWQMQNLEEMVGKVIRVPPKPGGADLLANVADVIGFRIENRDRVPAAIYNPIGIPVNPEYKWAMPQEWKTYPQPFPHVALGTGLDYAYQNPDHAAFVGWHQWQYWPVYGYTSDNGRTWKAFESFPNRRWNKEKKQYETGTPQGGQIAMSATNPKVMVWAPTWGSDPHYTQDGGRTWQPCTLEDGSPLPTSWPNSISPWVTPLILSSDRADPTGKTFYYFDGWVFYISQDGGATWRKGMSSGLPQWLVQPAIVSNPTRQGDVWMSFARNSEDVNGNPLYRSQDGGTTFSKVATVDSAEMVTFGKGRSATQPFIYIFGRVAGAKQDAMYQSQDMGKTWKQISHPEVQKFPGLSYLEGDMRTPNLVYASMGGRGILVGEGR